MRRKAVSNLISYNEKIGKNYSNKGEPKKSPIDLAGTARALGSFAPRRYEDKQDATDQ